MDEAAKRAARLARAAGTAPRDSSNQYDVVIRATGVLESYSSRVAAMRAFGVRSSSTIAMWARKGVGPSGNTWTLVDTRIPLRPGEKVAEFLNDGVVIKVTSRGRVWNTQCKRWSGFPDVNQIYIRLNNVGDQAETPRNLMCFGFRHDPEMKFRHDDYERAADCKTYREFRDAGWLGDHIFEIGDSRRHALAGIRVSARSQNGKDAGAKNIGTDNSAVGRPMFCPCEQPAPPATAKATAAKIWPSLDKKGQGTRARGMTRKSYTVEANTKFAYCGVAFVRLPDPLAPSDPTTLLRGVDPKGVKFVYNPDNGAFRRSTRRMFARGTAQPDTSSASGAVKYFCTYNGQTMRLVHRMIGLLFLPECLKAALVRARAEAVSKGLDPGKITVCDLVVDHINRTPSDNRLCNLRWATVSENMRNRSISVDQNYVWPCICSRCVARKQKNSAMSWQ